MHHRHSNAIVFVIISAFLLLYYAMIYFQMTTPLIRTVFFVGVVLFCVGLLEIEWKEHGMRTTGKELEIIISTLLGGITTFELSKYDAGYGPLGSVVAAGAIGLAGYEIIQKFRKNELAAPLYCGAFVGMSLGSIFSFEMIAAASLLAGALYIASRELYTGSGGKLGTIAFIGTTIIRALFGN